MNITIRKAKPKDLDSIITLCEEHAIYEGLAYSSIGKKERLAMHLFGEQTPLNCLLVENGGVVMGYATYMKEFSTWDASYYMHMDCLYLKQEIRGQGIGKKIVNKIKREAETQDCVNVQWQTPTNNTDAIGFYTKLGAISKNKKRFYML